MFPFGAPSGPRPPRKPTRPTKLFVLGVYPSALHVRWTLPTSAPAGLPPVVGALAVADEPTVFWDGTDADRLVEEWRQAVGFRTGDGPNDYGHVQAAGNGTSGRPVRDKVLARLGVTDDEAWFTDAIDQFFIKRGGTRRQQGDVIADVYERFAATRAELPSASLPARPTVNRLVHIGITEHRERLRNNIVEGAAPTIVTLGEEARRVLAGIADTVSGAPLLPLTRGEAISASYGTPGEAAVGTTKLKWFALAHPGNRDRYWTTLHTAWGERQPRAG